MAHKSPLLVIEHCLLPSYHHYQIKGPKEKSQDGFLHSIDHIEYKTKLNAQMPVAIIFVHLFFYLHGLMA